MNPNPQCMDDDLSLDPGPSCGSILHVPKQAVVEPAEMTPLDDCLAQLTSETAPSLRIPGSDGACSAFQLMLMAHAEGGMSYAPEALKVVAVAL